MYRMGLTAKNVRTSRGGPRFRPSTEPLEPRALLTIESPTLPHQEIAGDWATTPLDLHLSGLPTASEKLFRVPRNARYNTVHAGLASSDGRALAATAVNMHPESGRMTSSAVPKPGERTVRLSLPQGPAHHALHSPAPSSVQGGLAVTAPLTTIPAVVPSPALNVDNAGTLSFSPPSPSTTPGGNPQTVSPGPSTNPAPVSAPSSAPTPLFLGVLSGPSVTITPGALTSSPSGGWSPLPQSSARSLPASGSLAMGPLPLLSAGPFGGVLEQGDRARTVEARVAMEVDLALMDLPRGKAVPDRAVDERELGTVEWSAAGTSAGSVAVLRGSGGFPLLGTALMPARREAMVPPVLIGGGSNPGPTPPPATSSDDSSSGKSEKVGARDLTLRQASVVAGIALIISLGSRAVRPQKRFVTPCRVTGFDPLMPSRRLG